VPEVERGAAAGSRRHRVVAVEAALILLPVQFPGLLQAGLALAVRRTLLGAAEGCEARDLPGAGIALVRERDGETRARGKEFAAGLNAGGPQVEMLGVIGDREACAVLESGLEQASIHPKRM